MNHQDYDEDGNNIVPCPICLDVYCPSKEGGKCPKEDEFARDMGAKPAVEGTETEEALVEDVKYLCSPLAERMPDGVRLTALIHVATKMIDTLQSTRADERKKLVKVVKGMERHSWDSGIYNKALEDVLAKISKVWHLNRH